MSRVYTFIKEINLDSIYLTDPFLVSSANLLLSYFPQGDLQNAISIFSGIICYVCAIFLCKISGGLKDAKLIILPALFCFSLFLASNTTLVFLDLYPFLLLCVSREISAYPSIKTNWIKKTICGILDVYAYIYSGVLSFAHFLLISLTYSENKNERAIFYYTSRFVFSYLIFLVASSSSQIFDYPTIARLVDVSTFQRLGEVVFGMERLPLPIVPDSYIYNRNSSSIISLTSMLVILILIRFRYPKMLRGILKNTPVSCVYSLMGCILVSSLFDQEKYFQSPEGFLFNFIPGLIWRPYPWIFASYLLSIVFILLIRTKNQKITKIYSIQFFILTAVYFVFFNQGTFYIYASVLDEGSSATSIPLDKTPSNFLMESYKITTEALNPQRDLVSRKNLPIYDKTNCALKSNRNPSSVALIFDGKLETKWGTAGAQQVGDWISIDCKTEFEFSTLSLMLGKFVTDFPRGFVIYSGDSYGALIPVKKFNTWFGNVERTSGGLLYFGGQEKVEVEFNEVQKTKNLKISLTKGNSTFDWSIAELNFKK